MDRLLRVCARIKELFRTAGQDVPGLRRSVVVEQDAAGRAVQVLVLPAAQRAALRSFPSADRRTGLLQRDVLHTWIELQPLSTSLRRRTHLGRLHRWKGRVM